MIITSLSPSMVICYNNCPYQFLCRYGLKLPSRPNAFMALGSAFHATLAENYYRKLRTGRDLPLDLLKDFCAEDLECQDFERRAEELPATINDGVACVEAYQTYIAPEVLPLHVEHAWSMEVKNRRWIITGKDDLITVDNVVREAKTTGRRVNTPKEANMFQTSVYALARSLETGLPPKGCLDYAYRGKKDEVSSFPLDFPENLGKTVLRMFDDVARGIQMEVWPQRRFGNYLCSSKYCDYWTHCQG